MFDNITVDGMGRILLQEDRGKPTAPRQDLALRHQKRQPDRSSAPQREIFSAGAAAFLTEDEESSGIIDAATILGRGWFLLDVQAHQNISGTDPELVERGQLLAMYVDPSIGRGKEENDSKDSNIDNAALYEQADLIVMAKRRMGILRRVISPSISEQVSRRAPCPVLTLCPPEIQRPLAGRSRRAITGLFAGAQA